MRNRVEHAIFSLIRHSGLTICHFILLLCLAYIPTPSVQASPAAPMPPVVDASAYLVVDRRTDVVLLEHNADDALPMASLTKLMTAAVALEQAPLTDRIPVPDYIEGIEPTIMGLSPGEVLTVEELLAGLFLPSGNDAAETLATGIGKGSGGRDAFIAAMNEKAKMLGLTKTFFRNPTGFDLAGHQSSARDLARLTTYVLATYWEIGPIVGARTINLEKNTGHKFFHLVNGNVLLEQPFFTGVKIGNTPDAGECAIVTFEDGRRSLLVILLGSKNRQADIAKLIQFDL